MKEEWKSKHNGPGELAVFCVSNDQYELHLRGYARRDAPFLSLASTGMVDLRTWLLKLPARIKLDVTKHHCNDAVQSILTSVALPCTLDAAQRRDTWLKHTQETEEVKSTCKRAAGQMLNFREVTVTALLDHTKRLIEDKVSAIVVDMGMLLKVPRGLILTLQQKKMEKAWTNQAKRECEEQGGWFDHKMASPG